MRSRDFRPQWRVPTDADLIRIGLLFAALLIGTILWGCGGGPTTPLPPSPTPAPTATPTPLPTPNPHPTPATCPPAAEWGVGLHTCLDIRKGESCVVDSTPRYGDNRGQPCNEEHHEVCGGEHWRHCEDPRGPVWSLVGAPYCTDELRESGAFCWEVNKDNPFQLRVRHIAGRFTATACWPEDAKDEEGVALDMAHARCGSETIRPLE